MTGQSDQARAWEEYLAAAQQLDAVRRAAAGGEQPVRVDPEEVLRLQARLIPQQTRLQRAGVPASRLVPTPEEVAAASRALQGGPERAVAALRAARATADLADAVLIGSVPPPVPELPVWRRNLLVYGPFALVVFVVQVGLALAAGDRISGGALLCGLVLPLVAFGLGWLTVGLVFRPPAGEPVDRSTLLGAALCAAPLLVTLVWVAAAG